MAIAHRLACFVLTALIVGCGTTAEVPPPPVAEGTDAPARADTGPTRRLLVLARPGQSQRAVERAANAFFDDVRTVTALFPGVDDDVLSRSYIVVAGAADTGMGAWDTAYAFQAAGNFERVEPDQDDTLVPPFRHNAAASACAFEGTAANPDVAWSLKKINAAPAWALPPPGAGKLLGEGVSVCHPDTGWTQHDDLDALDLSRARNVMDGNHDARDPHDSGAFLNPGHGTATGSVIASRGGIAATAGTTPPGKITGVAPKATLVPIRTVKSVIQVFDSDVAKAVAYSVEAQCDVISMSLGGRGFFGLERAVELAVDNGIIVIAAGGNCVGSVVAPAAYDATIAAAATNDQDKPWKGSSRGRRITLSAPGENVWNANGQSATNLPADIKFSNGTSFATANIAGAAALWLAYHTRAEIERAAGGKANVGKLFARVLRNSARMPADWDQDKFGSGILDLEAMLREPIEPQGPFPAPAAHATGQDPADLLAGVIDRDVAEVRQALDVMLGHPADLDAAISRWTPELVDVAMRDPDAFHAALDRALAPPRPGAGPPRVQARSALAPRLSNALQSAMQ